MEHETWITKQDLFQRGWNVKLIERFIEPVAKTPNLRRKGALLNLYSLEEAERVEKSPEFIEHMSKRRSNGVKTEASLKWANQVQINFTKDVSVLALAESLGTEDGRKILAFLRHNFSNYSNLCKACDSRFAGKDALKIIRRRLTLQMCKCYSGLRPGGERQWEKWYPGEKL